MVSGVFIICSKWTQKHCDDPEFYEGFNVSPGLPAGCQTCSLGGYFWLLGFFDRKIINFIWKFVSKFSIPV